MKKYLFLFILLGFLAPSLAAQEFTEGIFTYRVLNDDQGNPTTNVAIVDISADETTDVVLPSSVSQNGMDYSVTCLVINIMPSNGFKSIYIPSSIVEIPYHFLVGEIECDPENPAFTTYDGVLYTKDFSELYLCPKNKEEFTTHEATKIIRDNAFLYSTRIKTIVLNEGLESIGYQAFFHCSSLTQINLPSTLKSIGRYAFGDCQNLNQTMEIGAELAEIAPGAFSPSGIVGFSVVRNNPNLSDFDGNLYSKDGTLLLAVAGGKKDILFPATLTTIGSNSFYGSQIEKITVPEGVAISEHSFNHSKAKAIELPSSVSVIPSGAFMNCVNLIDFTIQPTVTEIKDGAFWFCRSLENLVVPETVETVAADAFSYCHNVNVIFKGKEVDIENLWPENLPKESIDNPIYFAAGDTYTRLRNAFEPDGYFIRKVPSYWIDGYEILGPNSTTSHNWDMKEFLNVANGLQLDITLPEGVEITDIRFGDWSDRFADGTYNCQSSWTRLANGDYRLLAYTSNGSHYMYNTPVLSYTLASDENLKPGEMVFHNIIISVYGVRYTLEDKAWKITGFDVVFPELTEIEEGEEYQLPNPITAQIDGLTYEWQVDVPGAAVIEDNSVLKALRPDTFNLGVFFTGSNMGGAVIWGRDVTVTPALWGDADRSKAIDLADVVAVVNHILEREVENFSAKLADVNRDGSIDVADLTSIVKLVLAQPVPDEGEGDVTAAPGLRELSFGEAQLGADGKRHISLEIETSSDYTAMQTDIELPEGYTVESVSLGSELGKHALDYAAVAPQTTRLILYSASLAELPAGRKAAVVDLTLSGAGEGSIRASRALACDADGRSYTLAATEGPLNTTTGISSAESAGMSATAVAGGMEITAPEGTHVTVSDIAGRVLLSFTADAAPAFRPFAPGVYVVAFEGSAATAKVLVK